MAMGVKLHVELDPHPGMTEHEDLALLAHSIHRITDEPLEVTLPGGDVVYLKLVQVEVTNE